MKFEAEGDGMSFQAFSALYAHGTRRSEAMIEWEERQSAQHPQGSAGDLTDNHLPAHSGAGGAADLAGGDAS